jgi:hypothetical protein
VIHTFHPEAAAEYAEHVASISLCVRSLEYASMKLLNWWSPMSVKCPLATALSFRQPFAGQEFRIFLTTLFFERVMATFKFLRLHIIAAVLFTGLAGFNCIAWTE